MHTFTSLFGSQYDFMYQKNVSKLKELNLANVLSNFYFQLFPISNFLLQFGTILRFKLEQLLDYLYDQNLFIHLSLYLIPPLSPKHEWNSLEIMKI